MRKDRLKTPAPNATISNAASIFFGGVVTFSTHFAHEVLRELICKEDLIERCSNELRVTAETSPCFLLHCTDDKTVPVENSVRFYQALVANKVPA